MKIPMTIVMERVNRKLVRKYNEEIALEKLMSIGDILFEYIDEDECISKEFYDYVIKNI